MGDGWIEDDTRTGSSGLVEGGWWRGVLDYLVSCLCVCVCVSVCVCVCQCVSVLQGRHQPVEVNQWMCVFFG